MTEQTKDEKIIAERKAKFAAEREAETKAEAEARDAAAASSAGKEKTKGTENTEEAKADEEAKKKEAEANQSSQSQVEKEREKARQTNQSEDKTGKETKSPDQEPKKSNLEKRFADLTGQIKDLKSEKEVDQGKIAKLEAQLGVVIEEKEKIEKHLNMTAEDIAKDAEKKAETDRIAKALEEDKDLSREDKREMPDDEFLEWSAEDHVAAMRWLQRNERRREKERGEYQTQRDQSAKTKAIRDKQLESQKVVNARHPELDTNTREEELRKAGKSDQDVHDTLYKENPKYKAMTETVLELKKAGALEEIMAAENGPELLMAEMEKRMEKPTDKKPLTQDQIDKIKEDAIIEERERLKKIEPGVSSSRQTGFKPSAEKTEFQNEQERVAGLAGVPLTRLNERLARRKKIPGAKTYKDD